MPKTSGEAVHTNVVLVNLVGAVKVVILAVAVAVFPGFKPDPILQEAIGTIFLTGVCWWMRGDLGLQNKIEYHAEPKEKNDGY